MTADSAVPPTTDSERAELRKAIRRSVGIMAWDRVNRLVAAEVAAARAEERERCAQAINEEATARQTPPHLDGAYREGIHAGLRLAERIVTQTPDEHPDADFPDDPGSVNVHRYPTCRVASGGRP